MPLLKFDIFDIRVYLTICAVFFVFVGIPYMVGVMKEMDKWWFRKKKNKKINAEAFRSIVALRLQISVGVPL